MLSENRSLLVQLVVPKLISVPGITQTATFGSPTAEKPRVVVFQNSVVMSLSLT